MLDVSHRNLSFEFLATRTPPSEFSFKLFTHHRNGAFLESSVTDIGFYISELRIFFTIPNMNNRDLKQYLSLHST